MSVNLIAEYVTKRIILKKPFGFIPSICIWSLIFTYFSYSRTAAIKHIFLWQSVALLFGLLLIYKLFEWLTLSYFQFQFGLKNGTSFSYSSYLIFNGLSTSLSSLLFLALIIVNTLLGTSSRFLSGIAIIITTCMPAFFAYIVVDNDKTKAAATLLIPQILWFVVLAFVC